MSGPLDLMIHSISKERRKVRLKKRGSHDGVLPWSGLLEVKDRGLCLGPCWKQASKGYGGLVRDLTDRSRTRSTEKD